MAGRVTRGSAVPAIELEPSVAVSEPYSKHITHVPVVSCCRCAHGLILRAHGRYPASSSHWGAARFDSSVRRARGAADYFLGAAGNCAPPLGVPRAHLRDQPCGDVV